MKYYPVAINLKNQLTLVVGGGVVAQRKVKSLLESGAHIRIISPQLTPFLRILVRKNKANWIRRCIRKGDLAGAKLIIAATDDKKVNESLSRWAKSRKLLVNIVDNSRLSNFISPAVLCKSKALVTVYTDGKDPVLSRDLKNFLKENWDEFLLYRNKLRNNAI